MASAAAGAAREPLGPAPASAGYEVKAAATAEDVLSAAPQLTQNATKAMFAVWGKVDGFPVLKRDVAGGTPTGEIFVSNIEQRALPADKFAIPPGFTEQALGESASD